MLGAEIVVEEAAVAVRPGTFVNTRPATNMALAEWVVTAVVSAVEVAAETSFAPVGAEIVERIYRLDH